MKNTIFIAHTQLFSLMCVLCYSLKNGGMDMKGCPFLPILVRMSVFLCYFSHYVNIPVEVLKNTIFHLILGRMSAFLIMFIISIEKNIFLSYCHRVIFLNVCSVLFYHKSGYGHERVSFSSNIGENEFFLCYISHYAYIF